jgi:phage minor structural protein
MYQVTIKNGNNKTIINAVSTHVKAPRITGEIKQGINVIDSFTFEIFPNNQGYNKLHPLVTLVEVLNTNTKKLEFKGRILNVKSSMDSSGIFSKTGVCESELAYLMDSVQTYGEYHDITVRDFLGVILDNHNKKVNTSKRFTLGNVTVTDSNNSLYRYLGYTKTFDTIKDKLIDRLGGELQIRYEGDVRYLDYLKSIGSTKKTDIRLSKNLECIEEEKDPSQIITRLIPIGATLEKETEEGKEDAETEEESQKLTISSVNNGVIYIDDEEAISEFGIICGVHEWSNVTKAENLLSKAKKFLKTNNKTVKKYSLNALDLGLLGLNFNSFELYNSYPVINPVMDINETLRVIEKTIKIDEPENSTLVFANKFEDIKAKQSSANKKLNNVAEKIKLREVTSLMHSKRIANSELKIIDLTSKLEKVLKDIEELKK